MNLLKKNNLDFVVANLIYGFNKNQNEIWIFDKKGKTFLKKGKKEELADYIFDIIK
jgi:phosphopantothenoylcysteine synthetase/decarboxylase